MSKPLLVRLDNNTLTWSKVQLLLFEARSIVGLAAHRSCMMAGLQRQSLFMLKYNSYTRMRLLQYTHDYHAHFARHYLGRLVGGVLKRVLTTITLSWNIYMGSGRLQVTYARYFPQHIKHIAAPYLVGRMKGAVRAYGIFEVAL